MRALDTSLRKRFSKLSNDSPGRNSTVKYITSSPSGIATGDDSGAVPAQQELLARRKGDIVRLRWRELA
jgi:hypothetical protein